MKQLNIFPEPAADPVEPITLLSNGAGQDTTYLLWRLIHDQEFYKKHIIGKLVVVGSDTGAEHPHTYANEKLVRQMCIEAGIEYHWLTPEMGYHGRTWQSLKDQYKRNNGIGSAAFPQSCTDQLKVKVVDKFLEQYLKKLYDYEPGKKKVFEYHCSRAGQKIRYILGFAAKEESRTSNGNKFDAKWKKNSIERYFPLIIEGVDRQAAINYNEENIPWKVWPSNCMICFYSSDQEIVWLHRFYPEEFKDWICLEKAKLAKPTTAVKNLGVYGTITLEQKLEKALKLYGHWTDEELNEYKYSHGHCIKSKY